MEHLPGHIETAEGSPFRGHATAPAGHETLSGRGGCALGGHADRPDDAQELAADRGDNLRRGFAAPGELAVARAEPPLRLPGERRDRRRLAGLPLLECARHARAVAVGPRCLDDDAALIINWGGRGAVLTLYGANSPVPGDCAGRPLLMTIPTDKIPTTGHAYELVARQPDGSELRQTLPPRPERPLPWARPDSAADTARRESKAPKQRTP